MDAVLEASARWGSQGPIQTLGPLIHNPQALKQLSSRGVREVESATAVEQGTVVVRAHGIPIQEFRHLKERHRQRSLRLINGTCPEVARVQARIKRYASKGYFTVLLGTPGHAEIVAHESYASAGCVIVSTLSEAEGIALSPDQKVLVIAQTTFLVPDFQEIADHIRSRVRNCVVLNTICQDTWKRQKEAESICQRADYLVVIGGKASNNTRHLMELARAAGKPTQWVESTADLDVAPLRTAGTVGVLAGASTPTWTVQEVLETLQEVDQPLNWRWGARLAQTVQFPMAVTLGAVTGLLHHALDWPTGLAGPLLPFATHIARRAALPYLVPGGLEGKGIIQEQFLRRNRAVLLSMSGVLGMAALLCAFLLGAWVLAGTLALGLAMAIRSTRWKGWILRRLPARQDLGYALMPVLLAIGLPAFHFSAGERGETGLALLVMFFTSLALEGLQNLKVFREDRVVGREILAVAIGSRATRWLAVGLLIVSAALLAWLLIPRLITP